MTTGRSESAEASTPAPAPRIERQAYATPRLVRYGRVEALTLGSLSGHNDSQPTHSHP
jgi:hypothetical protein